MSRKALTAAVVAATIAWSVSLSAFLAPLTAKAAVGGSLVKASLPAVYYVGNDGKRYVFPNEKTYKTWYSDFSSVVTITDAELASMMIGGNVTYKPGVLMVKITTDNKVYAVAANGSLRPIASEAVAVALYGANWNQMIHDVPDAFFTNYSVGPAINSASDFSPASASSMATSINADKGLGSSTVSGSVSVMLSSSQPAGGTLPQGAMGVNFLKFDVKNASSTASMLNTLTVKRSGVGEAGDFSAVYVYSGAARLTTGRTINSSTNEATFSGLNLSLAAGETKTLWIGVDVDGGANVGDVNSLSIIGLTVGSSNASGLPVSGPSFTIAGVTVGNVTIDDGSSISTNVKAGGMAQKLASFKLTASGTEDVDLHSVALNFDGTANRTDISNLVLKQAGLSLATVASITDKDLAVFSLSSPMYMEKGASRTFEVFGDIAATADAGDTVLFNLDEESDLHVMGRTYGYGQIVNDSYTGTTVTIEAGKLTTTFNGPAAHDVASNGKDVELFNFTVAAQANLEFRKTYLRTEVSGTGVLSDIDDLKIVDVATGATLAGPIDLTGGANTFVDSIFTETWNLASGQSRTLKVTADINSAMDDGTTIKVYLGRDTGGPATVDQLFNPSEIRNLDNSSDLSLSDMVPSTSIAGNLHTVRESSLEVTVSSTPVQQTYIQGSQNVDLAAWSFTAGDAGEIRINQLSLDVWADDLMPNAVLQTAKLWNGSTQVGDTESPNSNNPGEMTFENLNLVIAAGQSITLKVTGNIAGALGEADELMLELTDVDATDADGDDVTEGLSGTEPTMDIAEAGSVTVVRAPSDTETEAGNVLGSASNVVLGKFKFSAVNEELRVAKARFQVSDASAVSSLSLWSGSTQIGSTMSVDGTGKASFSNLSGFIVPKDGDKTLTVKGNLNVVSNSGAMSGDEATVQLVATAGTFEVRGTSAGSSTLIDMFDGEDMGTVASYGDTLTGYEKYVRKSKPTVTLVSLPSTTLSGGDQVLMRFSIAADAAGDVSVAELNLDITASGAGGVTVTNAGNNSTLKTSEGFLNATVSFSSTQDTTNTMTIVLDEEQVIGAGSSKTFEVYATVSGAAPSNSVSSKLLDDSSEDTDDYASISGYNFVWSDRSASSHSLSTFDWINGFKVKTLPTDSQTLVK